MDKIFNDSKEKIKILSPLYQEKERKDGKKDEKRPEDMPTSASTSSQSIAMGGQRKLLNDIGVLSNIEHGHTTLAQRVLATAYPVDDSSWVSLVSEISIPGLKIVANKTDEKKGMNAGVSR